MLACAAVAFAFNVLCMMGSFPPDFHQMHEVGSILYEGTAL